MPGDTGTLLNGIISLGPDDVEAVGACYADGAQLELIDHFNRT